MGWSVAGLVFPSVLKEHIAFTFKSDKVDRSTLEAEGTEFL
jgi:hypothetical protein